MLFADLLSLHLVTFLMFFILVVYVTCCAKIRHFPHFGKTELVP